MSDNTRIYKTIGTFGWSGCGCEGSAHYDRIDGENQNGCAQPSIEDPYRVLGEEALNEGAIVRVTYELLDAGKEWDGKCRNPWPGHKHSCKVRKAEKEKS